MFTINLDVGNIVLEDGGDVDLCGRICQYMCRVVQGRGGVIVCSGCDVDEEAEKLG
jgi:hypothetical protein